MLLFFESADDLDLAQLSRIYKESLGNGSSFKSTQDFYNYFQYDFFSISNTACAVWEENGEYISALRLEPYHGGLLITGIETLPEQRGNGIAGKLMRAVLEHLKSTGIRRIYSHIHSKNIPSIRLHRDCGFSLAFDYAVFLDGSVSQWYDTYELKI